MSSATNKNDQLVEEYMSRVHHALRDLPRERRDAIVEDIRDHIHTARAAMDPENEAQIRQLLDDLGGPDAIRSEAGLPPVPEMGWGDRWAPWLLLLGGFLFMLGWLAGLALLWQSAAWKVRDKLVATLIWPGGLATGMYAMGVFDTPEGVTRCTGGLGGMTHCIRPVVSHLHVALMIAAMVLAVVAPVVVNIRLIRISARPAVR